MDKQELIQKAVIDLCGELPPPPHSKRNNKNGWYLLGGGKVLTHKNIPVWIDTDEFKEAAKNYNFLEEAEVEKNKPWDWYDHDQQKAIALPPAGADCEAKVLINTWFVGRVIAHAKSQGRTHAIFQYDQDYIALERIDCFRLIGHEARTKELEKNKVLDAVYDALGDLPCYKSAMAHLYDKGFLKLPESK